MRIAVCVKWVPVVARMKFDTETKRIVREGVPNELNAYDLLAVNRAVELKQTLGAEVTAYTMGPPSARQAMVHCLALGVDRTFHIVDPALAGSDTLATSQALALALAKEQYDLILFGSHSVDAETGQVGPEVAELLDLPQVTNVARLDVDGGRIRVERALDDAVEVWEAELPVLVSVTEGVAPEINPKRDDIKAAQEREIPEISAADLSDDPSIFGASGSPTWVAEIRFVESGRAQQLIEDDVSADEAARQIVALLDERGVLDPAERERRQPRPLAPAQARREGGPEVWAVAEIGPLGLRGVTRELLTAAQPVADALDGMVSAVLLGDPDARKYADELCHAGADFVLMAADEGLGEYRTDTYAATLSNAIQERKPYAVLLPSTVNGRDLAARVAARLRLGLTGDCIGLEVDEQQRLVQLKPAFGGNVVAPILSKTTPYMATIRPGLIDRLEPVATRPVRVHELKALANVEWPSVKHLETRSVDLDGGEEIETAWAVVCVGKGVGGPEHIHELDVLKDALGATYICTRDVADEGWMPKQLQVGLTGRSIAPDLYIGVGVRGDFNHLVGIQRAGTIMGVNNNRRSPIFRQSDIGVLGDWREIVPALAEVLKKRRVG